MTLTWSRRRRPIFLDIRDVLIYWLIDLPDHSIGKPPKGSVIKIAFAGGGSLEWGTDLLTDIALDVPLRGATIMLHDIDQAAFDPMARMGRKIPARIARCSS